jgi:hypothetical protein
MRAYLWKTLPLWGLLIACGPVDIDHSPANNVFDAETSSLEGGPGHWTAWFSTAIASQSAAARLGGAGLRVEVTAPFGWGIQTDNYPGFPAVAGEYRASFWARASLGAPGSARLRISWRDESGNELSADSVESEALGLDWVQTTGEVTAPSGTARVGISVSGDEDGDAGEVMSFDGFVVQKVATP